MIARGTMDEEAIIERCRAFTLTAAFAAQAGADCSGLLPSDSKNVQTKKLTAGTLKPGSWLRVERTQAQLTISGGEKSEISVEAEVEVGDSDPEMIKEFLNGTTLTFEPEADGFVLRLTSPWDRESGRRDRASRWNISYAARVDIRVPASQSLDVRNSFGNVALTGVSGRIVLGNESGEVRVTGGGGELQLENSFGAVQVADFKGPAEIRNESGEVRAERIAGRTEIKNSFKTVFFRTIGGPLTVAGESSSVLAEDIGGAVDVKNSFKNVVLRRTSGPITVRGESSAVSVEQVKALPAGSLVDIKTSFKPISLVLPASVEVEGSAKTEFGKITTDIPVYLVDAGSPAGKAVRFGAGKGGRDVVTLKLETTSDITIKKE